MKLYNVFLFPGPGNQPSTVRVSGVAVSQNISFHAGSRLSSSLTGFTLLNDSIALETVERYNLSLVGHDYTAEPNRVTLGPDTRLSITDDDGMMINNIMICQMFSPLSDVTVMFGSRTYSFLENAGRVGVPVRLSNDIAQPLQVNTGGKVCILLNC